MYGNGAPVEIYQEKCTESVMSCHINNIGSRAASYLQNVPVGRGNSLFSSTTTMHPNDLTGQETKSDTSDSSNGDSLEDETKSVSVVPDSVPEDDIDDISLKSQNSPVFGVQAPNRFSTEYPGDLSEELISDPDNLLERCDNMDVTETLDDDKSVGSTNLPKDAGNVLERCDNMDVTKTLDNDKSVGSTNLPKDAGNVLFHVDNNESTQTFPEDNSLMDLDKTLARSDDHDVTIKKDSADVDLSKTSNKRTYSDSQHCPFKKHFKGVTGHEFTRDQSGVGEGATVTLILLKSSHNLWMIHIHKKLSVW